MDFAKDHPRVFLSYARSDGETFATSLRKRLEEEEPEITLWQDRTQLEGGVGWEKQIKEALESVKFLVLVLTPNALKSSFVQQEWRWARELGVCVYPVKGVPDKDLNSATLPGWMRKVHFFDLTHEWDTFVNYLKSPCQIPRKPFMAPDLPKTLVERPEVFNQLLDSLLDEQHQNPIAITSSLHGAGGLGKTTLAAALCHHEEIMTAFDDGILWVTLGQNPKILEELTTLYAALTGERPSFINEEDATLHVAQKLDGLNCLIIIDDVWDITHLRPFLRVGRHGTRLITTRNFSVAAETTSVNVDEMTNSEAVKMLTSGLNLEKEDLSLFQSLAHRLGEWPLLLDLAGAALRHRLGRGDTVPGAISYLNLKLDKQGVSAFDHRNTQERHLAITRTIEVSLEHLTLTERTRYFDLAVFPEDQEIPLRDIGTLWGLDEFEVEELIQQLDNFSLLIFNLKTGTCRIHDIMRAYMMSKVEDSASLHGRLINSWGDPYHLPSNYAWCWFSHHLVEAGKKTDLRNLLRDFDWLQAKLDATNINYLLNDFRLLSDDSSLRVISSALQLSIHVLAGDKKQLAGQILGRLPNDDSQENLALRQKAMAWRGSSWLAPLEPSLTPPGGSLVLTLKGHKGRVQALAKVPHSSLMISGGDDATLILWDPIHGTEIRTFSGHRDWIRAVALPETGQQVVSISDDRTIRIWTVDNGVLEKTISHHMGWPLALAVAPDGKMAITASDDSTLRVWDLSDGTLQNTLRGHRAKVNALQLSPCGNWLISASDDRSIKVWNLSEMVEQHTLKGHAHRVNALCILNERNWVVSASSDDSIRAWDYQKGIFIKAITEDAIGVRGLVGTPDEQFVLAACEDNTVRMWSVEEGMLKQTYRGHNAWVNSVAVSCNGAFATSASDDHSLKVWDLKAGMDTFSFKGHKGRIRGIVVSPDGNQAVSTSNDRRLRCWDLNERRQSNIILGRSHWPIAHGSREQDLLSAAGDATIEMINLDTMKQARTFIGHTERIRALTVTNDGEYLVSASDDKTIKIWDLQKGKVKKTIAIQGRHWVRALAVTPNSNYVVSGADGLTIKVWDFHQGTEYQSFRGHGARPNSLAAFPDSERILSGADDCTIKVWTIGRETADFTLTGHTDRINGVAILSQTRAISCSDDHTLRVWDLDKTTNLATYSCDSPILACAIGKGGNMILAGDQVGRLHFLTFIEAHTE